LAYIDDDNLIGDDTRTIANTVDVLLNSCKYICLTINRKTSVYGSRTSSDHDGK
jgi:hypothetical protein